jgi:hypothetical protein
MLFMVVERFRDRDAKATASNMSAAGIEANFDRCFQLMECDDARLLQEWLLNWSDLMQCEIVPVVPSAETRELVERRL